MSPAPHERPLPACASRWELAPNLPDYTTTYTQFQWSQAQQLLLQGSDTEAPYHLNIAHLTVDRHAAGPLREQLALRWLGPDGQTRDYSYAQLSALSNRFANVLQDLDLGPNPTVFSLTGRVPELYIAALGTLKVGGVFCPLYAAFGPEPIRTRMVAGKATVLLTTTALYRKKIAPIRASLPTLKAVLLVDAPDSPDADDTNYNLTQLLTAASEDFVIPPTTAEQPALLHFTSGTTGQPKGAVHVHDAVVGHYMSARWVLDLRPGDVYWCTADPGWVTGTSYGIIAPLAVGATLICDAQEFHPERWYRILQEQQVTVWYTAPTAIRMLMSHGAQTAAQFDFSHLRLAASVGEPLNPDAVKWGLDTFGTPFHDTWWQTETGSIMIANFPAQPIKPGAMGKPLPGIEAALVQRQEDGSVDILDTAEAQGELAFRTGWPSMFRAYLNEPARYQQCFAHGWYLSGDLARRDADGYYWFVGRADDVIKSAGHLIGPFEVESTLLAHPAVAEAAVIGKPDAVAGELVLAFVTLKTGYTATDSLRRELLGFARKRLGPAVAPRGIEFSGPLPKTRSGKILRRLLKARELGLPEGDLSTLETPEPDSDNDPK